MSLMQKSDASEADGKYLLSNQVERILCSAIYYFFYSNRTEYHRRATVFKIKDVFYDKWMSVLKLPFCQEKTFIIPI